MLVAGVLKDDRMNPVCTVEGSEEEEISDGKGVRMERSSQEREVYKRKRLYNFFIIHVIQYKQ